MTTPEEVASFLRDFKVKLDIWGIIIRDDRSKNAQALLDLDITPAYRRQVLQQLQATDYSEGPINENLHQGASMWIFGKEVKAKEVYIKITLGIKGAQVICISFHVAEHAMKYPLKGKT